MYTHEIVFRREDSNHANPKQINFILLNIINDFDSFIYYYNPYAQLLTLLIWSIPFPQPFFCNPKRKGKDLS